MSRLFCFGCSFTSYDWPTWADILGKEVTHYENWGESGGGNQFIANSIIECHIKNNFTADDTIAVMWTNVSREDRYVKNQWLLTGNIFTQDMCPDKLIIDFADTRGYFIRDMATIYSINEFLKSIGCKYLFTSMVPLTNFDQYAHNSVPSEIADILPYYQPLLSELRPSPFEVIFNYDWRSRPFYSVVAAKNQNAWWKKWYNNVKGKEWPDCDSEDKFESLPEDIKKECIMKFGYTKKNIRHDMHPTPAEHMEYLDVVIPEFSLKPETRDWVNDIDRHIRNRTYNSNIWVQTNKPTRW